MFVKTLACSTRIVEKILGPPQRGLVHSSFAGATNFSFPAGFMLSLNASPRHIGCAAVSDGLLPLLPNGILLAAHPGEFPFTQLSPGMPAILGAGRLVLEPLACSLDLSLCPGWNPHINRPARLDPTAIQASYTCLVRLCQKHNQRSVLERQELAEATILELADRLCGRGPGLTPGGDDFLAGWMAVGWLLHGPQPEFLSQCQDILTLARARTHQLSQYWLACAAEGDVTRPVGALLAALNTSDPTPVEKAALDLLALGATSGFELLLGILYGISGKNPLTDSLDLSED